MSFTPAREPVLECEHQHPRRVSDPASDATTSKPACMGAAGGPRHHVTGITGAVRNGGAVVASGGYAAPCYDRGTNSDSHRDGGRAPFRFPPGGASWGRLTGVGRARERAHGACGETRRVMWPPPVRRAGRRAPTARRAQRRRSSNCRRRRRAPHPEWRAACAPAWPLSTASLWTAALCRTAAQTPS
jgi:hypothetical protein